MSDREKVIKGLKIHADSCGYRSHHCDTMECPYRYGDESCDIEEMCRDALELLKEQKGLMLALEQSNAVNEFLNAEVERLNGLLKEQEDIIKQYHKADTFLEAHGWSWEGR